MSAFWIFAVALTVAYIIYYCVIIAKDLAKPREQVSSDEETFDLVDAAPEPSKVVAMTDKGFQVQDGFGNVREQEITGVPAPLPPEKEDEDPGPTMGADGAPVTPVGRKVAAAQDEMVPIDPKSTGEQSLNDLKSIMEGRVPSVNIEKTYTPPEKSSGDETTKKELDHDGGQRI